MSFGKRSIPLKGNFLVKKQQTKMSNLKITKGWLNTTDYGLKINPPLTDRQFNKLGFTE